MKTLIRLVLVSSFFILTAVSQSNPNWGKWSWLIGEWTGEGSGKPGQGEGVFSLLPGLDSSILIRKNHSVYPAANNKPAIIHEDLMIVYLDNSGLASKAIYFDNEKHVISYMVTYSEKSIILTSEKLADTPVFRLVYTLLDKVTVNTKFEMSQDGQKFMTYIEGKSKRKKVLEHDE